MSNIFNAASNPLVDSITEVLNESPRFGRSSSDDNVSGYDVTSVTVIPAKNFPKDANGKATSTKMVDMEDEFEVVVHVDEQYGHNGRTITLAEDQRDVNGKWTLKFNQGSLDFLNKWHLLVKGYESKITSHRSHVVTVAQVKALFV